MWKKYPFSTHGFCMNPQLVFKFSRLGNYLQSRLKFKMEIRISKKGNLDFQDILPAWYIFVFPTQVFYDSMDGSNLPQVEMFPHQGVESRISKKGNLGFQDMLPDWGICIANAGFFL